MLNTNQQKVELREKCNFILDNIVNLYLSLFPDSRYIQALWGLDIIDTRYIQNEGFIIIDRYNEEPYDTVIRILPKVVDLINNKFPEKVNITNKIKRANIFVGLEELGIARSTKDRKLELLI